MPSVSSYGPPRLGGLPVSAACSARNMPPAAFCASVAATGDERGEPSLSGDEMSPMARDRCNTWPLPRPNPDDPNGDDQQTSPLMHGRIEEEGRYMFPHSGCSCRAHDSRV